MFESEFNQSSCRNIDLWSACGAANDAAGNRSNPGPPHGSREASGKRANRCSFAGATARLTSASVFSFQLFRRGCKGIRLAIDHNVSKIKFQLGCLSTAGCLCGDQASKDSRAFWGNHLIVY